MTYILDDDFDFLRVNEPKMFYGASNIIFENAKALRNRLTDAERLLWEQINAKKLGVKFRRQHPISFFIADFYCHEKKLIIELDGSIHNVKEVLENDLQRQAAIEAFEIKVIRFKNEEIYKNLNKVLEKIKEAMQAEQFAVPHLGGGGGLSKRIIPCLDVKDGRTVKGVNFVDLRDAGDPVELAAQYAQQGADELVF